MAKTGITIILHDGKTRKKRQWHLVPGPTDIRSTRKMLTALVPLPNHAIYRGLAGDDIIDLSIEGSFGYQKRRINGENKTGAEVFLEFRKGFFDRYGELTGSKDAGVVLRTKVEYHNWDENEHYWCEPMQFETPLGEDNRTFFRYVIELKNYQKIERKFDLPKPDKLTVARRLNNDIKDALATLSKAGQWLGTQSRNVESGLQRNVLQPLNQLSNSIETLVGGASRVINLPLRFVDGIRQGILDVIESAANVRGTLMTDTINQLRQNRRTLNRLRQFPELFEQDLNTGLGELAEQYFEALTGIESETQANRIRGGTNLDRLSSSQHLLNQRYEGVSTEEIRQGDTLQKIALRILDDANEWVLLAELNDLEPPFLSASGGPHQLAYGDKILIPTTPAFGGGGVSGGNASSLSIDEKLYGRDLFLEDIGGKLSVVIGPNNDLATVGGTRNLEQAAMLKTRIKKGHLLENKNYGLDLVIGVPNPDGQAQATKWSVEESVQSDPRFERVNAKVTQRGSKVDTDIALFAQNSGGATATNAVVKGV